MDELFDLLLDAMGGWRAAKDSHAMELWTALRQGIPKGPQIVPGPGDLSYYDDFDYDLYANCEW